MSVFRPVACIALVVLAGCSQRPRRVHQPTIAAAAAGKAAIAMYDTDGNGQIDGPELDKATSIKAVLAKLDTNHDGKVSDKEICDRIRGWQETRVGIVGVSCSVELDGTPVDGATVTFVPEGFLGANIKPCTGTSDAHGVVMPSVDDPELARRHIRGASYGLYKVKISGPRIPVKYGSDDSPFGAEVAIDANSIQEPLVFKLTSRESKPESHKP